MTNTSKSPIPTSVDILGSVIQMEGLLPEFEWSLSKTSDENNKGIFYVTFKISSQVATRPAPVTLVWDQKMVDIHYGATTQKCWNMGGMGSVRLNASAASQAPTISMFNYKGVNRFTLAVADVINTSGLMIRHAEETGCITTKLTLFVDPIPPLTEYETTIRFDTREQPYWDALKHVSEWWANMPEYAPAPVPEHARLPMYSSWYSFHLGITPEALEKQCKMAKELGMDSIIVDDGWQTEDKNRGYAYCGDWEVAPSKFPDFRKHVDNVHALGMKYLLWFSVPFVGIHTKAYTRFQNKFLNPPTPEDTKKREWFVLDPRFPDVREYLIGVYERSIREYDLDGFKLDFVDCFGTHESTKDSFGDGRDYQSVPEAADRLLTDVIARLRAIKPDVMIEFRQAYIGPAMRKYGNIFRVGDEPNNAAGNRIGSMQLKTTSGNTAIHSDMVMWHYEDTVESAAMQLLHVIFTVPQISVRLDEIPESHLNMVRQYVSFWRKHRDVLLDGAMHPLQPQHNYPAVIAETDTKVAGAAYANGFLPLPDVKGRELILINGTLEPRVVIELPADLGARTIKITSCTGEMLSEEKQTFKAGVHAITMPPASTAEIC